MVNGLVLCYTLTVKAIFFHPLMRGAKLRERGGTGSTVLLAVRPKNEKSMNGGSRCSHFAVRRM